MVVCYCLLSAGIVQHWKHSGHCSQPPLPHPVELQGHAMRSKVPWSRLLVVTLSLDFSLSEWYQAGSRMSSKGPRVDDVVTSLVLLGGSGTFWSLEEVKWLGNSSLKRVLDLAAAPPPCFQSIKRWAASSAMLVCLMFYLITGQRQQGRATADWKPGNPDLKQPSFLSLSLRTLPQRQKSGWPYRVNFWPYFWLQSRTSFCFPILRKTAGHSVW